MLASDVSGEKRVLIAINSLGGGGAEGVCINLANNLNNRGWDVSVLVLNLKKSVRRAQLDPKINLVILNRPHARSSLAPLLRYIFATKPNNILVFNHQIAVILVLLRMLFRFKYRVVARNINTLSRKRDLEVSFWHKNVVYIATKFFYRMVDHVVAQSHGMKNDLVSNFGFKAQDITVINNPVASDIESVASSSLPTCSDDYILCVGRIEKQKSFEYAVAAFEKLSKTYPSLQLKIVGTGSLESSLRDYVKSLGLLGKVHFEGYQTKIASYYVNAKAILLTSMYEGFPNVLVESIYMGTPAVSFDCESGPREIIIDGQNGYLIKFQDVDGLVEGVTKLIESPIDRETVRKTAERFSVSSIITKYEDILF